jgi:hypothetical protein
MSHLRLPQPVGPGSRIYIPQEQGGPVIPPGTGLPLNRLLRLAGLRRRYSNPPRIYVYILHEQDSPVQSQSQSQKSIVNSQSQKSKVKVTLRLMASQSACLGV